MKKFLSLLFALVTIGSYAQSVTSGRNLPLGGEDFLLRCRVPFSLAGSTLQTRKQDVLWDFSALSPMDEEEEDGIVIGRRDSLLSLAYTNACYDYLLRSDSLLEIGYSAPNLEVHHLRSRLALRYPFSLGDSIASLHYGEGLYSHALHLAAYGASWTKADAEGILILPEGDTLHHVLRLHEHQHLGQRLSPERSILCLGDASVYSDDSILTRLATDSVTWSVDTYRWYAAGYRYPVFEVTETHILAEGEDRTHTQRAYYTPIASMIFDDDEENIALRELLYARNNSDQSQEGSGNEAKTFPSYTYTSHFSSGGQSLDIDFFFDTEADVSFQLTTHQGYLIARTAPRRVSGSLRESFNLSSAPPCNVYVLTLFADGNTRSEKIVKD